MNARRAGWRNRGQALLETLVGMLALVPLALLVVWLGKVQSVRQSTIAASRLLAFECTVRLDACASSAGRARLADEIRRRAFSRVDTSVLSADRIEDSPPPAERNPLWVDRGNRPLLERFGDIGIRIDRPRFDAGESLAASRAGQIESDAFALLADKAGPGRFGLQIAEGLVDARVQVALSRRHGKSDFLHQLDSIALNVNAHTAVLSDAWSASGPRGDDRSVYARVKQGSRILGAYEDSLDARYLPVRGFIKLMGAIGLEPSAGAFSYHQADVDAVPPDRLAQGGAVPGYRTGSRGGPGQSGEEGGW